MGTDVTGTRTRRPTTRWGGGSSCAAASGSDPGLKSIRRRPRRRSRPAFFLGFFTREPNRDDPQRLCWRAWRRPTSTRRSSTLSAAVCCSSTSVRTRIDPRASSMTDPGAPRPAAAGCRSSASLRPLDSSLTECGRCIANFSTWHCRGSDARLVSRLLDETGQVLSLREPLPLRTLAEAHDVLHAPESLLGPQPFATGLCSRLCCGSGVAATPRRAAAVVKTTHSAARLAPVLLERSAGSTSPTTSASVPSPRLPKNWRGPAAH